MKIEVERKIHKGWQEWDSAKIEKSLKKKFPHLVCPFGKFQYVYSTKKGKISLIKLNKYTSDKKDLWEIYCLEGNLFDDIMRFGRKKDAEEMIFKIFRRRKKKDA